MIFCDFYDLCYIVDCYDIDGVSPASAIIFLFFFRKVLENKNFALSLHPQSDSNIGCKVQKLCGNSSVGRAQPCQGWGREFESRFPLLIIK